MSHRRFALAAVAVLLAVVVLVVAVGEPPGAAQSADATPSVSALASDLQRQHVATRAAVSFAESPIVPAVVGIGLGFGAGVIGSAAYAYRNRGMQ